MVPIKRERVPLNYQNWELCSDKNDNYHFTEGWALAFVIKCMYVDKKKSIFKGSRWSCSQRAEFPPEEG